MSEESLRIVAEFVGGIFLIFITHYLTKSHYEHKRQDDLADREYNRRIQFKNQKLAEVQSYLDNHLLAAQKLLEYQAAITLTDRIGVIQHYQTEFKKVPELTRLSASGTSNIAGLGDLELTNLNLKLNSLFIEEYASVSELTQKILHDEPFDKEALLEKVSKHYGEILLLISQMQIRLDKLAEK